MFPVQVNDFLSVLDGLEKAERLPEIFSSASVESTLLRKCVILKSEGGQFPDMSSAISYFRTAFDAASSKKRGVIELKPGVDRVFDGIKVGGSPLIVFNAQQRQRLQEVDLTFDATPCMCWARRDVLLQAQR